MTGDYPLVGVTLSRSEMLLIAALLDAPGIVGVDPPSTDAQHRGLDLLQAEHSLRARNAAVVHEDGRLLVVRDLLEVIATCAYPQRSLYVFHTRQDGVALQAFGHQRDEFYVFHTVINPELHNVSQVPSAEELVQAGLQLSPSAISSSPGSCELELGRDLLVQARTLSEQGRPGEALALLTDAGIASDQADWLVGMLSQPHTTTMLTTVVYQNNQALGREYTVVQTNDQALLMTQADTTDQRFKLQSTSYDELTNVLLQSFVQPVA